jgi:IS5 family transposase
MCRAQSQNALHTQPDNRSKTNLVLGIGKLGPSPSRYSNNSLLQIPGPNDLEMHQTRKGNQLYFGMKAHIGVDSRQGVVHSVCSTAASVADKHMLPDLLHDDERKVWGDRAYQGRARRFAKLHRMLRAQPRGGPDISRWLTSYNAERTGPRPGCEPR